jgi:circadian clock protein KaiC
LLYNRESGGEHNRQLYLLKSRGMAHSNQIREFLLTSSGIKLREVYIGPEGVVTGSARMQQEYKDRAAKLLREQERERGKREIVRKRRIIEAKIEQLKAELAAQEDEANLLDSEATMREERSIADRLDLGRGRSSTGNKKKGR